MSIVGAHEFHLKKTNLLTELSKKFGWTTEQNYILVSYFGLTQTENLWIIWYQKQQQNKQICKFNRIKFFILPAEYNSSCFLLVSDGKILLSFIVSPIHCL